jgi:hypothetical protein
MVEYYLEGDVPAEDPSTASTNPQQQRIPTQDQIATKNVLREASSNEPVSVEQQVKMSRNILNLFELEEVPQNEDEEMADGEDDDEPEVDLVDQQQRTERLKGVLPTLAQLWWANSDQMDVVTEKLADGSRDRK